MKKKYLILYVLLMVIMFSLTGRAVAESHSGVGNEPKAILSRYSGVAMPDKSVVMAATTDGLLLELGAEEGQLVQGGDTLGRLDDRVQSAVVESASLRASDTSRVEQAAAQVSILEFDLRKVEELHAKGVAYKRELDVAQVKLQEAQAMLNGVIAEKKQLKSDLAIERQKLESLRFVAPFSGVVMETMTQPGAALRVSDGVCRLADLDPLRVELPLPVELYGQLEASQEYRLFASGPVNHTLVARLKLIRPEIDSASATFVATFEIPNPGLDLPARFRVHLESTEPVKASLVLIQPK